MAGREFVFRAFGVSHHRDSPSIEIEGRLLSRLLRTARAKNSSGVLRPSSVAIPDGPEAIFFSAPQFFLSCECNTAVWSSTGLLGVVVACRRGTVLLAVANACA